MRYIGLDKPRSKGSIYFWRLVFAVTAAAALGFLWYATTQVEYVWQWERIPHYFWISEERSINSEFRGEIASLEAGRIIIRDDTGEAREVVLPAGAKTMLDQGAAVYYGDSLARCHYSAPGILLQGLWLTLEVCVLAIIIGIAVGILAGLCRVSENPALRWWAVLYVELIRGTPLLVQIFIWYFVVGVLVDQLLVQAGLPSIPALCYGVIALAVFTGAYVAEIVRAGIGAVDAGQMEAARSLGMSYWQGMSLVVMPQAVRNILPALGNEFVVVIKESSLVSAIGLHELMFNARTVLSITYNAWAAYIGAALFYLMMTFSVSRLVALFERRLKAGDRSPGAP